MATKQGKTVIALINAVLAITMASPMVTKGSTDVKDGLYLGAMFAYNHMSGDFDDSTFLVSSSDSDIYDVPDVDDGMGFGVLVGWRLDRYSMELVYQRSSHDTSSSFVDMDGSDAFYNLVDLDFKIDVFAQSKLRPYVLFGVGIPWLTIEDGSTDGFSYKDETFVGFDLGVGAGVAYYFTPQWAITGGVIHRWNWFNTVEGDGVHDTLMEKALGFTIGLAYTF